MSIKFNWDNFSEKVTNDIRKLIEKTMNEVIGADPQYVGSFKVQKFSFGKIAPEVKLKEIVSLSQQLIEVIASVQYNGDSIVQISNRIKIDLMAFSSMRSKLFQMEKPIFPVSIAISNVQFNAKIIFKVYTSLLDLTVKHNDEKREFDTISLQLKEVNPKLPIFNMTIKNNFEKSFPRVGKFVSNQVVSQIKKEIKKLTLYPMVINMKKEKWVMDSGIYEMVNFKNNLQKYFKMLDKDIEIKQKKKKKNFKDF